MNILTFPTVNDTALAMANALVQAALEAVSDRGAFHLALSGGSSPQLMYQHLRNFHMPWHATYVYFSDERNVGPESSDSNYGAAYSTLLQHVPLPSEQVHRMEGELRPLENAAFAYEKILPEKLDLVLLGMGDDGHTASLFPGTAGLSATGRVVANAVPQLNTQRLTLTFPEINAARLRWLLVTGAGKASVLHKIQVKDGYFPVMGVHDPVWFLDQEAAQSLVL